MTKKFSNKFFILLIVTIFSLVNLSVISSVFCSMKNMSSSCCCAEKTAKKSCCENKKEVKYVSGCVCEIKEMTKEPAEISGTYTLSNISSKIFFNNLSDNFTGKTETEFLKTAVNTFHSPPSQDINTLKCVLRI